MCKKKKNNETIIGLMQEEIYIFNKNCNIHQSYLNYLEYFQSTLSNSDDEIESETFGTLFN